MVEVKELKEKILYLLRTDKEFAFELHKAILSLYGDELVTKTYLDESLYKLSKEFDEKLAKQSKEFDEKLAKQSEDLKRYFEERFLQLSKEFDEKLAKQSKEFDEKLAKQSKEFDEKLAKQSKEFDEKLLMLSKDLRNFARELLGTLGKRWGTDAEESISRFAQELIKDFGGKVSKWNKKVKVQIGKRTFDKFYEIDVVITDSKVILIEVKSSCSVNEIEKFIEACELYEEESGKRASDKIIVTFFVYDEAKKIADEKSIKIISPI